MNVNEFQMNELKHAVEVAAMRNRRSNRYQFVFFDKMMQALGVRPNRDILKQAHAMIKEENPVREIAKLVFGNCRFSKSTSPTKLNNVQYRLLKHIVHTFRRLFKQRDEGWVDSFLVTGASSYCYAMIGGPTPGECDIDTLIRMLKDGSTDEEIMRWYIGDFTVVDSTKQ